MSDSTKPARGGLPEPEEWTPDATIGIEPERYELSEPPRHYFELERREFFRVMGAGVAILIALRGTKALAQEAGRTPAGHRIPQQIGAWLHVGENGIVTVFSGKVEIGQNARTSLSEQVAEELRVPLDKIDLVLGDTARTPWDRGTFGSETTPIMGTQLRRAAALARALIVAQAVRQWKVDADRLQAKDGLVRDPASGRSAAYGELLKGQQLAEVIPAREVLTPPAEWTLAGTSVPKIGGPDFVTGRHRYNSDVRLPGMMHGVMVRPSAFGATLQSIDSAAAEAMPGVTVVRDGDFVGVVAPSRALAERAAAAVKTSWKETPQPSNAEIFEYLKTHSRSSGITKGDRGSPESNVLLQGSVPDGLAAADHKLAQTYTVRYIAHCPLEPRVGIARWEDGKLTAWCGSQRPFGVRADLAKTFRISEERVRVIVLDNSPAYGGKHTGDAAVEAARLAQAVKQPVKVFWSRPEEMTWAYFRPAGVFEVRSGVTRDGKLTAWEYHNYNSGMAAIGSPYYVPNKHIQFHLSDSPLRQGSYRGLAATANHFARETHMDELAHLVRLDPLEFRRRNIRDARLRTVFETAAKAFGWGRAKDDATGFGIAGGTEKGSYIATCAEVRVDRSTGAVRVARVLSAFECGAIVNPEGLGNQVEGALMYGLGGALFEQIEFDSGRIRNARFALYRLPRFSDMPKIESVLLDRKDIQPAGAGETPMFGLAPAIGNAIFDAVGIRLRAMPMVPTGLDPKNLQAKAVPRDGGFPAANRL